MNDFEHNRRTINPLAPQTPRTCVCEGDASPFICSHAADRSLLKEGFTFPGAMLCDFTEWFGALAIGESREVIIRLDGKEHLAKVGNRGFDRKKWPDHPEMYQLRYAKTGTLSRALREKFAATREIIERTLAAQGPAFGKRHIPIPADRREQILFYRTDNPLVWDAEVQTAEESAMAAQSVMRVEETLFESLSWTDADAGLVLKPAVVKVRRLDRTIGQNLKRLYDHRCQICGTPAGERYGAKVDEVHHINPFVTSLNNDANNLIVLCPNHHRIVHAAHAEFLRPKKAFRYPNGLVERLELNWHL